MLKLSQSKSQRCLQIYYGSIVVRIILETLYIITQIALFVLLTILPLKIAFYYLMQGTVFSKTLQIAFLVVFILHILLYIDNKAKRILENPEMQKKLLFKNRVVRLKWLSILSVELVLDIICLAIAIFQATSFNQSLADRLIEIVYLLKLYKLVVFNNRIVKLVIGTSFYVFYNILFGVLMLIVLVSYVASIFYIIDYELYLTGTYQYPQLLWILVSAWPDIVQNSLWIQIQYALYWSLGTASGAAYGNVSASAPQDVLFNIICLYFEGFLFGFYLSRIHALPQTIMKQQTELLDSYHLFFQHNLEITNSMYGKPLSEQLYFKILCSLEYHQNTQGAFQQIEKFVPKKYMIQIKSQFYKQFLNKNLLNLWSDMDLRQKLCLKLSQKKIQKHQCFYDYEKINRTDLLFINKGKANSYLFIDNFQMFKHQVNKNQFVGIFSFITNTHSKYFEVFSQTYCNLFVLKRQDIKSIMNVQQKLGFQSLFNQQINFQFQSNHTIDLYRKACGKQGLDMVFMNSNQKNQNQIIKSNLNQKLNRKKFKRTYISHKKKYFAQRINENIPKTKDVGVQCQKIIILKSQIDSVLLQ